MAKFAVIETGGKQYRVAPGQKIKVEKLATEAGANFSFDKVLLSADGDAVHIGTPYLDKTAVEAKVLRVARDRKKIIYKYHSKNRFHRKKGHRQFFTEVEIVKV